MLSKIALLVLGLIDEKPLNPYEIQKFIEAVRFNKMYSMSTSSIYATINGLVKRDLIYGTKKKEGKMPEKTIYSSTKKGKTVLNRSLTRYLSECENIFSEFDIAMSFVCHLERQDAVEAIEKHIKSVENIIADSEKEYKEFYKAGTIPYTGLTRRRHYIYKRKAELKTLTEFKKKIEVDDKWNHFPAPEWML